jgi:DHA1 family bicyclomycin/chloramphenicol resistance-like MFS transporter
MLAPTIGGYVTAAGWHVVFLILMGIGIVVLLASHFGLPHTLNQILRFRWNQNQLFLIFGAWWENLSFILMLYGSNSFLWVIRTSRPPYSFMDVFKVDATTYGWIFALVLLVLVNWTLFYWKFSSEQMIFRLWLCNLLLVSLFWLHL